MISYVDYPPVVAQDIARLRRRIEASKVPHKATDQNLLVATWNVRAFGAVFESFDENLGSPKRNLRGLAYLAEVIRHFDVVALQEVKRETTGLRFLLREFLGPSWQAILSDVTVGAAGNSERLAFLYDQRRVQPSGLAGEVVLPPSPLGNPVEQFDRTPYICGFQAGSERFSLLTAHIRFGDSPQDRIPEISALSAFTADEIRDRAKEQTAEETNLIVLGDFNIDARGNNPLFQAFIQNGLFVPQQLLGLRTTSGAKDKFFDQIAWFMGDLSLSFNQKAGVVDFAGAVFQELTTSQMSFRVSDHFPLWVEFTTDRSTEQLAGVLGVDPATPDPLAVVPD